MRSQNELLRQHTEKITRLQKSIEQWDNDPIEIISWKQEKILAPIRSKALRLLDQRQRSTAELRERLLSYDFEPQDIDQVIESCIDSGLLNDSEFAAEWVRQRHESRGRSKQQLRVELLRKGISGSDIDHALEQISAESEHAAIEKIITKKAKTIKVIPETYQEHQKLLSKLVGAAVRKGYNMDLSLEVASETLDSALSELK